jgi:glycine cleavage system aminomethyltransferase T
MSDLTVTRLDKNRFWILTGAGGGPQDLAWIRRNAPRDGSVQIRDFSSEYTAVGLWGPKARQVLEKVCDDDVSDKAFPYFTARPLQITTVPALALRVSYAGELGWEIYCPCEQGLKLWDELWEAGREFGLVAAGAGAFGSLRLEKGYRAWGADIHTEYNPFEAGLGWAVQMGKGEFIGRDALRAVKRKGVKRALCCMIFEDEAAICLGKEPILSMSGEKLGYVTSADYGYSVGKYIAFGYLPIEQADIGNKVRVQYFDKTYTATVVDEPLFDPGMKRLKS